MSMSQAPLAGRSSPMSHMTADPLPGLVVIRGAQAGTVYYLAAPMITIGRDPDNDVQLDDPGVAPHHASIRRQPTARTGTFYVYDLASPAGVQVNGETIVLRHPLDPGDRVTVGRAVLEFFTPKG